MCLPSRPYVIACVLVAGRGVHGVADPSDLARFVDVSELLMVEADPDPERITNAAKELANDQPRLKAKRVAGSVGQGPRGEPADAWSFSDVVRSTAS